MNAQQRAERLEQDLQCLQSLSAASGILDIQPQGDPPDRYTITLHGQGVGNVGMSKDVEWIDQHRVELRLPFMYPQQPPDIRWETPLFHPNLSYSGLLRLEDVGLPWSEQVGLDVVCERLWDVARLAFVDLKHAVNSSAKRWIQDQEATPSAAGSPHAAPVAFPVDPRPLRKIELPGSRSNVVRYHRRDTGSAVEVSEAEPVEDGVLVINEQTASPPVANDVRATPRQQPPPSSNDGDDDLFYIGDE